MALNIFAKPERPVIVIMAEEFDAEGTGGCGQLAVEYLCVFIRYREKIRSEKHYGAESAVRVYTKCLCPRGYASMPMINYRPPAGVHC